MVGLNKFNLANDDPIVGKYLISWFAHKIQRPEKKIGVTIVCKSILQGIGKNTLFDMLITYVMGSKYGVEVTNNEELFNHFNEQFGKSLLVMCDEIGGMGAMMRKADEFKSIVTRNVFNLEKKGVDKVKMPDRNDYILFSNNDWIVRCEASDRRHLCLDVSIKRVNQFKYWAQMYASMNDKVGLHLFHYLANYDISEFNPRDIPMTEWKRELKMKSIDPLSKMLIEFANNHLDDTLERFHWKEFYDAYSAMNIIDKNRLTLRSFSVNLQKLLDRTPLPSPFGKNGIKARGFEMTISQLKDRIRFIMNDKDFVFGKDQYEELLVTEDDPESRVDTEINPSIINGFRSIIGHPII